MDTEAQTGTALSKALASSKERLFYKRLPEPSTAFPIDFASSDYLSLSLIPSLRSDFLQKLSAGSRTVVNGNAHTMLENRAKAFFGYEAAVLCNSGYDANLAFFEIHASIHDGMKVSKVKKEDMVSYKHNDMGELKKALKAVRERAPNASIFVAVESLYSMDGTMAPLVEICDLADEVGGHVFVDEAHAIGVYGPRGRGRVALFGLENRVLATLAPFSKALNCSGAVILTRNLVQDFITNYSRTWIYTTTQNYPSVIAADCCLDVLEDGRSEKLSEQLFDRIDQFIAALQPRLQDIPPEIVTLAPHFMGSVPREKLSPIIPLITRQPKALSEHLKKYGITAPDITFPLVPKGLERVRLCFKAGHSEKDVELLASVVAEFAVTKARSSKL
ncbi:pyridoxal phosphate-dependent transferase [Amanita rubescens]|nr:pyridoxal phosphate-dependent transferase [Amanita rubescens]